MDSTNRPTKRPSSGNHMSDHWRVSCPSLIEQKSSKNLISDVTLDLQPCRIGRYPRQRSRRLPHSFLNLWRDSSRFDKNLNTRLSLFARQQRHIWIFTTFDLCTLSHQTRWVEVVDCRFLLDLKNCIFHPSEHLTRSSQRPTSLGRSHWAHEGIGAQISITLRTLSPRQTRSNRCQRGVERQPLSIILHPQTDAWSPSELRCWLKFSLTHDD